MKDPLPLHLSGICEVGKHHLCGGWTCACDCHDIAGELDSDPINHYGPGHTHHQVDNCVYCECGSRIYQGQLMDPDAYAAFGASIAQLAMSLHETWKHNRAVIAEAKRLRDKVQ